MIRAASICGALAALGAAIADRFWFAAVLAAVLALVFLLVREGWEL